MTAAVFGKNGALLRYGDLSQDEVLAEGEVLFLKVDDVSRAYCKDNSLHYLTNEEYSRFKNKPSFFHQWDWLQLRWIDGRDLQNLKDCQWQSIKAARTDNEYAGFTWDGSTFDSDAISQQRITGAVTLAQMSPEFVIDWTLADNTVRTLIREEMVAVGIALGVHVQTQFAKAQALRVAIEAATTQTEIEAVVW